MTHLSQGVRGEKESLWYPCLYHTKARVNQEMYVHPACLLRAACCFFSYIRSEGVSVNHSFQNSIPLPQRPACCGSEHHASKAEPGRPCTKHCRTRWVICHLGGQFLMGHICNRAGGPTSVCTSSGFQGHLSLESNRLRCPHLLTCLPKYFMAAGKEAHDSLLQDVARAQ